MGKNYLEEDCLVFREKVRSESYPEYKSFADVQLERFSL